MAEMEAPMEVKKKKGNVVAGTVGAFLGSLIGVACIVIVGQMGYVASVCGLVMAVCALKGYELLGGGLGKPGAAVSSVLIVVMTYLAHQLDWAVSAASALETGILEAFRAIPYLREVGAIEARSYWGGLAMLYLFTLVGAVPTVLAGLRGDSLPDMPPASAAAAGETAENLALYPSDRRWTKPLRLSASLSMLVGLVPGIILLLLWMGNANGAEEPPIWWLFAALGCIGSAFVMMFAAWPKLRLCDADFQVLARSGGTVWKIHLSTLNMMDTYRFTKKRGSIQSLRWDKLSEEEQNRARLSIARAVDLLQSGQVMSGSALSRAVMPLTDLEITGEDSWRWKGTYSVSSGKRKKVSIAKAFPGFAPTQDVERSDGPMPWRWSMLVIALAVALALGAAAAVVGAGAFSGTGFGAPKKQEPPAARAPESAKTYSVDGVSFQMDGALVPSGDDEFSDPDRELRYAVSVSRGQDMDGAKEILLEPIGDNRMKYDFDSFSFLYAQEEDVIIPMTAADGSSYQHGLLSVYFTDGNAIQRAVALSDDGILFTVTASRGKGVDETEVNAALLFILESIQVSEEARTLGRITGENYQSLFHLDEEDGYSLIGKGYIRAPEGMSDEEDAFVDVYLPYSESPEFLEDGHAIRTAAHGMEVTVTMAHTDGTAAAVVDEAYAALTASGAEPYEGEEAQTQYVEEYDIAFRQVIYLGEGDRPRMTVLYADRKQEGYYLSARITYLLEQTDDDYPLLVAELGDVFSLTLPELDPFEE